MKKISQLDYTNISGVRYSAKSLIKAILRDTLMPERFIVLNSVRLKDEYTVVYDYSVSDSMRRYFRLENEFFVQYDFKIDKIPESILIIPFMTNVLPIAWLTDATLFVEEVDYEFAKNIKNMRDAFRAIHPKISFKGRVKIGKMFKNNYKVSKRVAMGFSGGVDSFQTFTSHFEEKPELITLIGSDIFFDDQAGIERITNNTITTAKRYNLGYRIVKTNFRGFLNEEQLSKLTAPIVNDGYWHAIQHGVGIIGNMAPIAYNDRLSTFYFSSTFTKREFDERVSCSSYPITDESVRLSKCSVVHDGFEYTRQQKVHNIVEFSKKESFTPLRVCWRSTGGANCSACEKCFRTIMALIAEGEDANNYGFHYTRELGEKIKKIVDSDSVRKDEVLAPLWRAIKLRAKENVDYIKSSYPELAWIMDIAI